VESKTFVSFSTSLTTTYPSLTFLTIMNLFMIMLSGQLGISARLQDFLKSLIMNLWQIK